MSRDGVCPAWTKQTGTNSDGWNIPTPLNSIQVYVVAKRCAERCTPEEYSIALAQHFLKEYPKV